MKSGVTSKDGRRQLKAAVTYPASTTVEQIGEDRKIIQERFLQALKQEASKQALDPQHLNHIGRIREGDKDIELVMETFVWEWEEKPTAAYLSQQSGDDVIAGQKFDRETPRPASGLLS